MYKKIKRQNGEKFAQTLRSFHDGILEIPDLDIILRHAGRDAKPLLPYLMGLIAPKDDIPLPQVDDPFVLLDIAGYDAFHADTLTKQNSIRRYFSKDELLCTFNDASRYQQYHIVNAVKKTIDQINRADFIGKEQRQDDYGTSVISIQISKRGGFIKITNRYNHTVNGGDNTFSSNPDRIIQGLSQALKEHFSVSFTSNGDLPNDYTLIGRQILEYHKEFNNIYYGDGAWVEEGAIHEVDKSAGDAMFDGFLFDNKTKTLKNIDPQILDSFPDDFNRYYGGNKALFVRNGNLMLNGDTLIGAEKSLIKTLYLPAFTAMGNNCLFNHMTLTHFSAPALTIMGPRCLYYADALTHFDAPALMTMDTQCLRYPSALAQFNAPALTTMADDCLSGAYGLIHLNVSALISMGHNCLYAAKALIKFSAPKLTTMGHGCLRHTGALTQFNAPALTTMGNLCLHSARALTHFNAPALTTIGQDCLRETKALIECNAPTINTTRKGLTASPY